MSERTMTGAMRAAVSEAVVCPFFAVEAEFPSGTVRIWTGIGTLTFGGDDYDGMGEFLGLELVEESVDGGAKGIVMRLSGIPSEVMEPVTLEDYHGKAASLYFGCFDAASGLVISDPVTLFAGQMDSDEVVEDGKTSTITIRAEHRLSDLLRPRDYRYTLEGQHALQGATTDDGLEFVPRLQETPIQWGEV